MGKPHFDLTKLEPGAPTTPPTSGQNEGGEIVIRADRVVLGSSVRRRLRVVCFENPESVANRRLRINP